MTPKRGMLFEHRHWLSPNYSGKPLVCKVMAIRNGVIYYRPFYGYHDDGSPWLGAPYWVETAKFDSIAAEEVIALHLPKTTLSVDLQHIKRLVFEEKEPE